ncbi:MAG: hypothetical protein PHH06_02905 [Candidatus Gracilibacteria bacterium]|nr:hypothetical protein [Candidatus Gracilibacteria bacterium]
MSTSINGLVFNDQVCPNCNSNDYHGGNCINCGFFIEDLQNGEYSLNVNIQLKLSSSRVTNVLQLNKTTYCGTCGMPMRRDKRRKAYCYRCRS